jgi:hypothetical protein
MRPLLALACLASCNLDSRLLNTTRDAAVMDGADAVASDAVTDAQPDATPDVGAPDLDWAQWQMPDSPTPFCTNGSSSSVNCAGTGQDGESLVNVPTYTTTTDTVTDPITGLMWARNVASGNVDRAGAHTYCDGLVLATFSDWRVPTEIELLSIVDFGRVIPCADSSVFGTIAIDAYWSTDLNVADTTQTWVVVFHSGNAALVANTLTHPVRCVRNP